MATWDLSRFLRAQQYDYEQALTEIRAGEKRSHWMWYVYPQLKGLGHSEMAEYFGISGLEEARAYLEDPVLGARLREITGALLALPEEKRNVDRVFGFPDNLKLRSSMTLFAQAAEAGSVFQQVLDVYFDGQADERTLALLGLS